MSFVHGTPVAYERHKCRCDKCRETHNARIRRTRAERLAAGRVNHGSAAGWDDGCRCMVCRDAHQERHYSYADRKREEAQR